MSTYFRKNRVAFKFSGPDAQKLLNDVLSGKIVETPGPASWWALLSPQGKIQAEGLSGWFEGAFWLDVARPIAENFFKRMRMYKLRAEVEITDLSESHVVGWADRLPDGVPGAVHEDIRGGGLGFRLIAEQSAAKDWAEEDISFMARRIGQGIAELGPDFEPDRLFPHDIAMDLLDGIDFKKGCYVGQEVVSRMRHRGTARRRPIIVSDIADGTDRTVLVNGRSVGETGEAVAGKAIGILRLDKLGEADGAIQNGRPVTLAVPHWASYDFADSGKD